MRAVALIPAYNEADLIASTVAAVASLESVVGVIVIDDASKDGTGQFAAEAGALVRCLERRKGKGAVLEYGCRVLEETAPFGSHESLDAVLFIDADLGASAGQASVLLAALESGADLSIAGFPPAAGKAGFGMVKALAHDTILELGGFETHAPLSGQRALTMPCLKAVRPFAHGFGVEVAMSVKALWADMRLVEVPTTMAHRASGRTLQGFLHRGRQYFEVRLARRDLLREYRKR